MKMWDCYIDSHLSKYCRGSAESCSLKWAGLLAQDLTAEKVMNWDLQTLPDSAYCIKIRNTTYI